MLEADSSEMMCFALSNPLHYALLAHGVENELVATDTGEFQHIYLRLSDGRVLDVSGDQFNGMLANVPEMPEVYLGAASGVLHASPQSWPSMKAWKGLVHRACELSDGSGAAIGRFVRIVFHSLPGMRS